MSHKHTYEHSEVFARMKSVKETLSTNLTTAQYLQTLDNLLFSAVTHLVVHTRTVDAHVANILGWQDNNRRRKVSMLPTLDEFRAKATIWLLTQSRQDKADTIRALKLERGALIELCSQFLRVTKEYQDACFSQRKDETGEPYSLERNLIYKRSVEEALGASPALLAVRQDVERWYDATLAYKNVILEKYIRLALNTAQKDYVQVFQHRVPLNDIAQTYMLAVSRAIDRTDASQGALTTQVQFWLLTARTHLQKAVATDATDLDEAYDVSDETACTEDNLLARQQLDVYREVARLVDPLGAASAYLGLLVHPDGETPVST